MVQLIGAIYESKEGSVNTQGIIPQRVSAWDQAVVVALLRAVNHQADLLRRKDRNANEMALKEDY